LVLRQKIKEIFCSNFLPRITNRKSKEKITMADVMPQASFHTHTHMRVRTHVRAHRYNKF